MEKFKELEISEMIQISGGVNLAYEIGYAIGNSLRQLILFTGLRSLF
jgi:bacteriocin-like protein